MSANSHSLTSLSLRARLDSPSFARARNRARRLARAQAGFLFASLILAAACGDQIEAPPTTPGGPLSNMDAQAVQAADAGPLAPTDSGGTGVFVPPGFEAGQVAVASDASASDAARSDAQVMTGHNHDHCMGGELADARDKELTGKPDAWRGSAVDLVLPAKVLEWMHERVWEQAHDAWHNVRRCRMGGVFPGGRSPLCNKPELVAPNAECANAEDGYQFLVMHRHMMQALRQAFPTYPDLFKGFPRFPAQASDVPTEWQGRWGTGFAQSVRETAALLEDIENKLSQFPSEGELGKFIQCGMMASGASSIHGALHFKWVVNDSPHSLGKQTVNVDNYMFWKLHGWIDQIWERYRKAKGLTPDEPKLKQALVAQCQEMDRLGKEFSGGAGTRDAGVAMPLPMESGFFHEKVRPIFERVCSGCHSEASPEANLSLGGAISSADVVEGLVNAQTARGGSFMRVVPGNPQRSWLYLKVAGMAAAAGCTGTCSTGVMPPAGMVTLAQADLDVIRQWIMDGAPAPTN
jgi:hypothetical protein